MAKYIVQLPWYVCVCVCQCVCACVYARISQGAPTKRPVYPVPVQSHVLGPTQRPTPQLTVQVGTAQAAPIHPGQQRRSRRVAGTSRILYTVTGLTEQRALRQPPTANQERPEDSGSPESLRAGDSDFQD